MLEMKNKGIDPSVLLTEEEQIVFKRHINRMINRYHADLKRNISENRIKIKKSPAEMFLLRALSETIIINEIWHHAAHSLLSIAHLSTQNEELSYRQEKLEDIKQTFLKDISESMDQSIEEFLKNTAESEEG